ncbi:hypothetical protein [Planktothricoides raciborskii]|nr:hypothetical protein [Planktothricoides raciborskii]
MAIRPYRGTKKETRFLSSGEAIPSGTLRDRASSVWDLALFKNG